MRDDLIPRNVASGERPQSSRHRKEVNVLSGEQVKALVREAAGERNEALFVLAVHTGLRQGEILGLKWTDIDLDAKRLSVSRALKKVEGGWDFGPPKNSASRRSVPLSKTASAALRSHRTRQNEEGPRAPGWQDHGLVFPSRVGTPSDRSNIYRVEYLPLLQRSGLGDEGFTFHSLRHTFASELFRQGRRPKVIQTLLGHSSIMQTMDTYSHLLDGVDDDEVGGLDDAFGV
jgi:integrase